MLARWIIAGAALLAATAAGAQRAPVVPGGPQPVAALIKSLELGRPVEHGGLTIIPVYRDRIAGRTPYATLDEAVRNGWVLVSEVDGGRVPQVEISNLSRRTIFLMGGEILTGCRQDRILAQDVLLAPGTKGLLAPVYCVEQGRWTPVSGGFTSKENLGTPSMRAAAMTQRPAAQAEIWDGIASQNRKMDVASPTGAYQDAYETEANKAALRGIEKTMKDAPFLERDAVGVIIAVAGRPVSVDIFASPDLFAREWPKILKSSALSSIGGPKGPSIGREEAAALLRSFLGRKYRAQDGLDLGIEYVANDRDIQVRALADQGSVVHLAGFPLENDRIKVVR